LAVWILDRRAVDASCIDGTRSPNCGRRLIRRRRDAFGCHELQQEPRERCVLMKAKSTFFVRTAAGVRVHALRLEPRRLVREAARSLDPLSSAISIIYRGDRRRDPPPMYSCENLGGYRALSRSVQQGSIRLLKKAERHSPPTIDAQRRM
jgi:hypothetical protein